MCRKLLVYFLSKRLENKINRYELVLSPIESNKENHNYINTQYVNEDNESPKNEDNYCLCISKFLCSLCCCFEICERNISSSNGRTRKGSVLSNNQVTIIKSDDYKNIFSKRHLLNTKCD